MLFCQPPKLIAAERLAFAGGAGERKIHSQPLQIQRDAFYPDEPCTLLELLCVASAGERRGEEDKRTFTAGGIAERYEKALSDVAEVIAEQL